MSSVMVLMISVNTFSLKRKQSQLESKLQKNAAIIVLKWTQWFCSVRTGVPLQIQAGEVLIASLLGYKGVKEDLYLF